MNKEEKKAIEIVKQIGIGKYVEGKAKAIYTVLNLIENLQKENEELKALDLSNSKMIANMSTRHFHDREKIRNSIPVKEVKDLKDRILKNEEYTIVLKGDGGFPDNVTEATFEKYINLKVLDELIERRK